MKNKLQELADLFDLHFRDFSLLERAMTHSSYANEHNTVSNERLEFIGDAVLPIVSGSVDREWMERITAPSTGAETRTKATRTTKLALAY